MDKENNPPTPAEHAEEEQVKPLVSLLMKLEKDLDNAVHPPCDTVAIADAAEEIIFSMLGLKGEEEPREEVSTVILAIVDYAFTQGITAAGMYLGVQRKLEFTEAVETYCETQEHLISCATIGTLVDAHLVKEEEERNRKDDLAWYPYQHGIMDTRCAPYEEEVRQGCGSLNFPSICIGQNNQKPRPSRPPPGEAPEGPASPWW